jgi:tripartite-type tricarboxylate transporter receptor subunit TctC
MRHIIKAAGMMALLASGAVQAQGAGDYPNKPVTMVVPFSPGAATDIEGRVYANKLGETWGQSFVLDFKPGANMLIGMGAVLKAKPDGYTLLYVSSSYSLLPLQVKNLPFDPIRNFEQVSLLSKRSAIIAIAPDLPVKNVQEFIAYARAKPGEVNFATAGNGSIQHLTGLWLQSAINARFTFVHFKAAGSGYPDLMAGRVHATPMTFQTSLPLLKSGKLKAIGVASLQRNALLPDLPTFTEQGVPDFEYSSWLGLLAPEKTPAPIVNKLHQELARIIKLPDITGKLGAETALYALPPAEFRKYAQNETARWMRLVRENNITFED